MVRLAEEEINKGEMNRGEPTTITRNKQQHQHNRGVGGQLQGEFWDPGGFEQSWRGHE